MFAARWALGARHDRVIRLARAYRSLTVLRELTVINNDVIVGVGRAPVKGCVGASARVDGSTEIPRLWRFHLAVMLLAVMLLAVRLLAVMLLAVRLLAVMLRNASQISLVAASSFGKY